MKIEDMRIEAQLGMRIRYLRKSKKMSIEDLALECGINRNYLCDLERGIRNPTLQMLDKIANGFGISISELTLGLQSINK